MEEADTVDTVAATPERSVLRRLRFREAVAGLSERARRADLLRWVVVPGAAAVLLGLNFILFGWWGAAHTARQIEQIPYLISGGLFGLALIFLGGLVLASAFWIVLLRRSQQEAEARTSTYLLELEGRMAALVETRRGGDAGGGHARPAAARDRRAGPATRSETKT